MVGDFKTDEVLAKIQKYFEDIPKQTRLRSQT
jgi:predicted Zn-dependent peptidase